MLPIKTLGLSIDQYVQPDTAIPFPLLFTSTLPVVPRRGVGVTLVRGVCVIVCVWYRYRVCWGN